MKKRRFTEEQIAFALRQYEAETSVPDITRKMGIAEQTFSRWKKKYAGLGVTELGGSSCLRRRTGSSSSWSPI